MKETGRPITNNESYTLSEGNHNAGKILVSGSKVTIRHARNPARNEAGKQISATTLSSPELTRAPETHSEVEVVVMMQNLPAAKTEKTTDAHLTYAYALTHMDLRELGLW